MELRHYTMIYHSVVPANVTKWYMLKTIYRNELPKHQDKRRMI